MPLEQGRKRSKARIPNLETNLGDRQIGMDEEALRLIDTPFGQEIVRSLIECLCKEAMKVERRKASFLGGVVQRKRPIV